jgi:hypothetical protein
MTSNAQTAHGPFPLPRERTLWVEFVNLHALSLSLSLPPPLSLPTLSLHQQQASLYCKIHTYTSTHTYIHVRTYVHTHLIAKGGIAHLTEEHILYKRTHSIYAWSQSVAAQALRLKWTRAWKYMHGMHTCICDVHVARPYTRANTRVLNARAQGTHST